MLINSQTAIPGIETLTVKQNITKPKMASTQWLTSIIRTRFCTFYTKYWITNCTGLPLRFYKVGHMMEEDELISGQHDIQGL